MNEIKEVEKEEMHTSSINTDAMRRAAAFPVKGGDILPFKRKSWFKTTEQKQPLPKRA